MTVRCYVDLQDIFSYLLCDCLCVPLLSEEVKDGQSASIDKISLVF